MGSAIRKLIDSFFKTKDLKILILGLDGAGKTVLVNKLNLGEVSHTVPTIGFNIKTVQYKRAKFAIWDVGGQTQIRMLWRHYFQGANGIIFVVDSADTERIELVKKELYSLLVNDELKGAPLLVFANKQDLKGMTPEEVKTKLGLQTLKNRNWFLQGCCALTGDGLSEGMDWLCHALK